MALSYLLLICYRQNSISLFLLCLWYYGLPFFPLHCPPKAHFSNMKWTMLQVLLSNIPYYKKNRAPFNECFNATSSCHYLGSPFSFVHNEEHLICTVPRFMEGQEKNFNLLHLKWTAPKAKTKRVVNWCLCTI